MGNNVKTNTATSKTIITEKDGIDHLGATERRTSAVPEIRYTLLDHLKRYPLIAAAFACIAFVGIRGGICCHILPLTVAYWMMAIIGCPFVLFTAISTARDVRRRLNDELANNPDGLQRAEQVQSRDEKLGRRP